MNALEKTAKIESLLRKLYSGNTLLSYEIVSGYTEIIITPAFHSLGITEYWLGIYPEFYPQIEYSLPSTYRVYRDIDEVIDKSKMEDGAIYKNTFGEDTIIGIQDQNKWVFVQTRNGHEDVILSILPGLWYQFYEYQ